MNFYIKFSFKFIFINLQNLINTIQQFLTLFYQQYLYSKILILLTLLTFNFLTHTFGAQIDLKLEFGGNGLDTPPLNEDVKKAFFDANKYVFNGNLPLFVGCGGSIPFMEVFGGMFENANFILTGVGFPDSNAHAANENLDLEFCRKLTNVIAITLANL